MSDALALANWLLTHGKAAAINHLKLQKLLFYAYGAAAAFDLEPELGSIPFVAWKHGPVNREVYGAFSGNGRQGISPVAASRAYGGALSSVLNDVLAVYGRLTPWQIRDESHLEGPWIETEQSAAISPALIKAHFKTKFAGGAVAMPRHLVRAWSFDVDGVPLQTWSTLNSLAVALRGAGPATMA